MSDGSGEGFSMGRLPDLLPDEEQVAFHYAIGEAITQWVWIENAVFNIASLCFTKEETQRLGAAMHAVENFRSKLAFADRAFRFSQFNEKLGDEWGQLRT